MTDWWRGSTIYQIYPRSFYDSNDDGVGDLRGIISKLDYIKDLGVDGIWLSPFFSSPMKDFGYDICDYKDVDPLFGTLDDFDQLICEAHARGLKVIIDQVYSHTSNQHPWFEESRSGSDNPKSDWYIWADAKPDGTPPNNWLSVFGGPAWTWDAIRQQYYLQNFLSEQPDLNFHHPEVRKAILEVATFWLDRNVDGFRLDVANFYYCDQDLRDNPVAKSTEDAKRPYDHQHHLYDRSRPETLLFLEEFRALLDRYSDRMSVAEIFSDDPLTRSQEYTAPNRLHTAYNFFLLDDGPLTPQLIKTAVKAWDKSDNCPSWSFSNHDVIRAATRWGPGDTPPTFSQMLMGLLLSLPGTIFLYQGEELGLPHADVPYHLLQDPEGIRFWPDSLGRDGCRTPMPWKENALNAGFSAAKPWLPVDPRHNKLAIDVQDNDQASTLNRARIMIGLRRSSDALKYGTIEFLETPDPILAFKRKWKNQIYCCIFNLGANAETLKLMQPGRVINTGLVSDHHGDKITLAPFGGAIIDETN